MVKKIAKFLAYLAFFLFALVLFTPKESFYFLLEQELQKLHVVISNENLQDKFVSLHVSNLEITTKGIDSAIVADADIMFLGLYNRLSMKNIQLSSLIESYAPSKIERLHVSYLLLNPLVIVADIAGDFGEAKVTLHLLDKELKAIVIPSKIMQSKYPNTMRMLKKDENGEYTYAKTL